MNLRLAQRTLPGLAVIIVASIAVAAYWHFRPQPVVHRRIIVEADVSKFFTRLCWNKDTTYFQLFDGINKNTTHIDSIAQRFVLAASHAGIPPPRYLGSSFLPGGTGSLRLVDSLEVAMRSSGRSLSERLTALGVKSVAVEKISGPRLAIDGDFPASLDSISLAPHLESYHIEIRLTFDHFDYVEIIDSILVAESENPQRVAGRDPFSSALSVLGSTVVCRREALPNVLATLNDKRFRAFLSPDLEIVTGREETLEDQRYVELIFVSRTPIIEELEIRGTQVLHDEETETFTLDFHLSAPAESRWANMTKQFLLQKLSIVFDNQVVFHGRVGWSGGHPMFAIGHTAILGIGSEEEALALAERLTSSKSMPLSFRVVSTEETVSAAKNK